MSPQQLSALLNVDLRAIELRIVQQIADRDAALAIDNVLGSIKSRAGVLRRGIQLYFSTNEDKPPTLQWFNPRTGKQRNGKADQGRSRRRVVVGVAWLQREMPKEFAFLCAYRVQYCTAPIEQLTVE